MRAIFKASLSCLDHQLWMTGPNLLEGRWFGGTFGAELGENVGTLGSLCGALECLIELLSR